MQGVYNFIQVQPELATSGVVAKESFAALRADGYDVVINLLPGDSQYAVVDEAEVVAASGMDYVHIPVDFSAPAAADYDHFVAAMEAAQGQKIWVHCAANWRVSSFVALYAERAFGWTLSAADELVEKAWGEPDEVWRRFIADTRARQGNV